MDVGLPDDNLPAANADSDPANVTSPTATTREPADEPEWKVQNDYSYYRALKYDRKEIRLVTINPGSSDDPVRCILTRHQLLPGDADFEALSYCWGDLQDTTTILLRHDYVGHTGSSDIAGQSHPDNEQCFSVTKSLHVALRHLRYKDEPRVIWIDALCINQGSIRERNYAIPFMVDIYRAASQVVIFLGEEDKGKNFTRIWQLMDMIRAAVERRLIDQGITGPLAEQKIDVQELVDSLQITQKSDKYKGDELFRLHMSLAFEEFFRYPWFQRVWVVQEVLNAKQTVVHCGGTRRDWLDVVLFLCLVIRQSRSYSGLLTGSVDLRDKLPPFLWTKLIRTQLGGASDRFLPILDVLARGRAFQATDPRDKVFALLAFGEETHNIEQLQPRLKPDYAKSASEVWRDVTRQWIIEHQSLDILGLIREEVDKQNQAAPGSTVIVGKSKEQPKSSAGEAPQGHPSWALWHVAHPSAAFRGLFRLGQNLSKCSLPLNSELLMHPSDSSRLSLRGIALDKIKNVQLPFKRWLISDEDLSQFNYDNHATFVAGGVPIAWGVVIGLIQLDADSTKALIKTGTSLSIGAYPNGSNILQSFIETLICRRFSREYFLAGNDDNRFKEFVQWSSCLHDKDSGEEQEATLIPSPTDTDPRMKDDLQAMAHFAAHWTRSRSDPEMKWIPAPLSRRLQVLVKHGSSKKFTEMCTFAEGRCFFQLRNGAFGLCPQGTKEDDWVVTLSGGNVPFVLRPTMEDEDGDAREGYAQHPRPPKDVKWTLVGECYVHDLDICRITKETWSKRPDSVQEFHIM